MMTFSSVLASTIEKYLTLKRALGRQYALEERVLACMDRFLAARHADLNAETFDAWCLTLQHLASGNRRGYMRQVRNLCLYRRRHEPGCFVPDDRLFPPLHQVIRPHIFTDSQLSRLLVAARTLAHTPNSPLCPENMRLAIVLLYTTGLRRGELIRLTVGDFDRHERTLAIRESKFHKSRLIPLSADSSNEIGHVLDIRERQRFPVDADSPLLWHRNRSYSGGGLSCTLRIFSSRRRSAPLPATCHARMTFVMDLPLRLCFAGTAPESTCKPGCPCWPPIWGTSRSFRPPTTCNLSNLSQRQQARALQSITERSSRRRPTVEVRDESAQTEHPGSRASQLFR